MATAQNRIEFTDIVTVTEAAELAGCTPQHIRRLCDAGTIPAKKHGPQWIVSAAAAIALRGTLPRSLGGEKKSDRPSPRRRRK
jgi:excisionase family DNA binding protein